MRMKMPSLAAIVVLAGCATTGAPSLRGHYTWGHEVETFRPCGSTQTFWVTGDAALLQPLRALSAAASQARGQPYQPIYVEASVVAEGKANDGFAADYDGVYRLASVERAEAPSDSGQCDVPP
jgi:hypothetical protein